MWETFFRALALVLIFEGIFPFSTPKRWRRAILKVNALSDRTLRVYGLISMIIGMLILQVSHIT